ncbi:OstA-like protein [Reichenbachiella sp. MALMAid0571]|uniref:OstA-like protein n=1 Tax=Reichenbachiella sp. MALMAid0571 TaxID=3143939 RepID=UPI0032DF57D1
MRFLKFLPLLLIVFALQWEAYGQKRPRYKADVVEYHGRGKVKFRKLIGNVVFTHESTVIHCDSSYQYTKDNRLEAFGHVHIKDGDSVTITSKKLVYEGATRQAKLRENVVYKNGGRTLYTDILDYDLIEKIADFRDHGKLIDAENTLTSDNGRFFSQINYAVFYKEVKLVSPTYDLEADTLEYSTTTKIAITKGPTKIITDDNTTVHALGGEFKTAVDVTIFDEGVIETKEYILEGDELFLDDATKFYTAIGNVKLTSKNEDVVIIGKKGIYDQSAGRSKIFGNPVMKKLMELDTFFLAADTLVAIESEIEADKRILAYYDVKLFKSNLQGKCDSMSYFMSDSMIVMYDDPILWNHKSQIEADSIDLYLVNDIIDKMKMRKSSFLASEDTLGQFNQVKGRNMTAYFDQGAISAMDINGNGESLYYLLEGDSIMLGMNKILCGDMRIIFKNGDPLTISFYNQPEAELIPPHELSKDKMNLEGFVWRKAEKPTLEDVVSYYRKEGYVEKDVMEKIKEVQKQYKVDEKVIPAEIKMPDKEKFKNRNIPRLKNTEF